MRRRALLGSCAAAGVLATAGISTARAQLDGESVGSALNAGSTFFPDMIALPGRFAPAGIAIGTRAYGYFGSPVDGAIYRANLITGHGTVINSGDGTPAYGLRVDRRDRLFVAGGSGGDLRVLDGSTGQELVNYRFADGPGFISDLVVTPHAIWTIDSFATPLLYRLPLARRGALPGRHALRRIRVSGDLVNGNGVTITGIATTPDSFGLLAQTTTGGLFHVDPRTGVTRTIIVDGQPLSSGGGLLRESRLLYAVQNADNALAVLRLDDAGRRGRVVGRVTDLRLTRPTAVAVYRSRLYVTTTRATGDGSTDSYSAIGIPRPG